MIKKPVFHIILISLFLWALGWYLASFNTFFTVDTGLRFVQVRNLIENNWQTFAINYPQQIIDPLFENVPYYYAYSLIDGNIYFNVSHIYPLLVSFLYNFLSIAGLPIVAIAGGILTAVAIYNLAKLTELSNPLILLWITIFATPILFYCFELWDHTLAAACGAWTVYGIAKGLVNNRWQPMLWAGLIAGFGLAQRPEMYVFTLVLGLSVLIIAWRKWLLIFAFVLGGVTGTLIIWGLQYIWVGHPFGLAFAPHFFGYGAPTEYIVQPINFPPLYKFTFLLFYIEPGSMLTFVATLLILVGAILIVFSLRVETLRKPILLLAGGVASIIGYLLLMYWARIGIIPGVISTFPLFALSLTFVDDENGRYTQIHRFVFFVAFLFFGAMLLLWPTYGGRQWGARYLLPVYPLLAYLAYYTYNILQSKLQSNMLKTLRYVALGLLITSVLVQFMGVRALYMVKQDKAIQRTFISSLVPNLIVTDETQSHVPPAMATLTDKQFLQTGSEKNQQELFAKLKVESVSHFGFVADSNLGPPHIPANLCYELNEEQSLLECGGGSSCWVYQISTECEG